jgi:hypothetical protein
MKIGMVLVLQKQTMVLRKGMLRRKKGLWFKNVAGKWRWGCDYGKMLRISEKRVTEPLGRLT